MAASVPISQPPHHAREAEAKKGKRDGVGRKPVFEMVVLGSGGGPLETDCSGYIVKPYRDRWEDGFVALEGGSGIGALVNLFAYKDPSDMFPTLTFPDTHNTPVLKAAYVFSLLTCYLITHAHLDHALSLILLTGSVPPRLATRPRSPLSSPPVAMGTTSLKPTSGPSAPRPPVYGTRDTLERLAAAYGGGLWPELGSWAPEEDGEGFPDRGIVGKVKGAVEDVNKAAGVIFSPLVPSRTHRPLNPTLPVTTLTFPVAHGCTSHGTYDSSAMFIRYDPSALTSKRPFDGDKPADDPPAPEEYEADMREFLFFGDVESQWRRQGEEDKDRAGAERAGSLCKEIWEEAAKSWNEGRLAGVFIECSYDSARPAHLMFGHVSPPGVYHELSTLAAMVGGKRPLDGLRVYITHIKDALIPHPTGKTAREIIMSELRDLEEQGGLGVEFVEVKKGDRLLI